MVGHVLLHGRAQPWVLWRFRQLSLQLYSDLLEPCIPMSVTTLDPVAERPRSGSALLSWLVCMARGIAADPLADSAAFFSSAPRPTWLLFPVCRRPHLLPQHLSDFGRCSDLPIFANNLSYSMACLTPAWMRSSPLACGSWVDPLPVHKGTSLVCLRMAVPDYREQWLQLSPGVVSERNCLGRPEGAPSFTGNMAVLGAGTQRAWTLWDVLSRHRVK
jgi:hypothetical protein